MQSPRATIPTATFVATLAFAAAVHAQPAFRIVDGGPSDATAFCTFPGPTLNESGQAIAAHGRDGSGQVRSFFIDSDGTRTDIGTLSNWDTYATGINDGGAIMGQSAFHVENTTWFHAFVWTAAGGMRDLTPDTHGGFPCGINRKGDVVGFAADTDRAFLYTDGQVFDLNALPIDGGDRWTRFSRALSINDRGQIFGIGVIDGLSHAFIMTPRDSRTTNLLIDGGFEGAAPALGAPGWLADASRQSLGFSENHQPRTGHKNGACWTPDNLDCGIYQDVIVPEAGTYELTIHANADRSGGLVGFNVDGGSGGARAVAVNGFGLYSAYTQTFTVAKGSTIRVWMYSPATPGYVVIDDASLTLKVAAAATTTQN